MNIIIEFKCRHTNERKDTFVVMLRNLIFLTDLRKKKPTPGPKYLVAQTIGPCETLAFATEPVLASLANILGYLEDRLPQNLPSSVRDYKFLDIEIKYGLLQVTEALTFFHYSCKLIHRNLCPQSVIVNKRGTWKLAGLEFAERCNESDLMSPVPCQPFTSKLPKMGQPDLDFTAPEVQATSTCSPLSDMFSLGMLICAVFNNGRSLIDANHSTTNYNKQLELVSMLFLCIIKSVKTSPNE
ncbi:SCY1-like protein 2 [Trichonephila clavata]|uniref:SCY1-like protein 2 n=1 Tax=Trichonephila clavata TaxID=2740835 RepID=A0A8X6GUJ0_TRICU|nr:SCY1-like protein 2 [Trichonephila clavata]